jgi:predicted phosphodiesterase
VKVAVFSDMHGNCIAFDAMLAHLKENPADQIVCLGDTTQGGPQPHETLQRLRDLNCPVVMGNADAWMLTGINTSTAEAPPSQQMEDIRQWSLSKLTAEDKAFIESFQPTVEIPLEGGRTLHCFHATPHNFDDVFLPSTPQDEFENFLRDRVPAIMTGGHTHVQYIRRLADTFYFNPGSVGLAYSHYQPDDTFRTDPWAEYAVLTAMPDGYVALEFRKVPYDMDALRHYILGSDMPHKEKVAVKHRPEK